MQPLSSGQAKLCHYLCQHFQSLAVHCNVVSVVTDVLWTHYYTPDKIGADTIYHSPQYPSALTLPVMEGA